MLSPNIISTREMLRNYKNIFQQVKQTRKPTVIVSQKQPQVAIVNLSDLKVLQDIQYRNSTKALLDLAGLIPTGSGLPTDLSQKHSEYAWD